MLRATIELCPYGRTDPESTKPLVVVNYWNMSGGGDYADYGYEVVTYETLDNSIPRARPASYDRATITSTHTGTIWNFPRRALGSAHLLARVLNDAGYAAEMAD